MWEVKHTVNGVTDTVYSSRDEYSALNAYTRQLQLTNVGIVCLFENSRLVKHDAREG